MDQVLRFIKDWMLAFAIGIGAAAYLCYSRFGLFDPIRPYAADAVAVIQPTLLFLMLFLSFCKVDPKQLRFHRWHLWLLLIQCITFAVLGITVFLFSDMPVVVKVLIESAMICLICPTATAAAVVTDKLGGDVPGIVTYTMLINIATALLVPVIVPIIHVEGANYSFGTMFWMILSRVVPMLVFPLLLAWLVRYAMPRLHALLLKPRNLAFYLWCVGLSIAIATSTRSLLRSQHGWEIAVLIAAVSFVCCIAQFMIGHRLGRRYANNRGLGDDKVMIAQTTAGQALGQKNTIFIIWVAYTFFDPVSSLAGGFYSIWHNIYNSWQLSKKR